MITQNLLLWVKLKPLNEDLSLIVHWLMQVQVRWWLFCSPRSLCQGQRCQRNKLYSWSVRSSESLGRTETETLFSWILSLPSSSRTRRKVGTWAGGTGRDVWMACSPLFIFTFDPFAAMPEPPTCGLCSISTFAVSRCSRKWNLGAGMWDWWLIVPLLINCSPLVGCAQTYVLIQSTLLLQFIFSEMF